MKRKTMAGRLSALLLCCTAIVPQMHGGEVTIGTADGNTSYLPVNLGRDYVYAETVYAASDLLEVGNGNQITSLAYVGDCTLAGTANMQVYLSNTTMSTAPTSQSDLSAMTKVYDGPVSVVEPETSPGTILKVDFNDAFTYAGSNLHIVTVVDNISSGSAYFSYTKVQGACSFTYTEGGSLWSGSSYGYYRPVIKLDVSGEAKPVHSVTVGSAGNYDCTNYGSPLDLGSNHSISETLYTADELGIGANQKLKSISYRGWTNADDNGETFAIKVWMENTDDGKYDSGNLVAADVSTMTKVFDNTVTIPKDGSYGNYVNIVTLDFGDNGFNYTGNNLRVVVQCDNDNTKSVYFAYDPSKQNSSIYQYSNGSTAISDKRTLFTKGLPVTVFTYQEGTAETPVTKTPEITLTTTKESGLFGFTVWTNIADDGTAGGVLVDFGDGVLKEYPYSGSVSINNDLQGNVVKVYSRTEGLGLEYFACYDQQITDVAIDAPMLNTLNLQDNEISEIDLSGCPILEQIILEGNKLISFDYQQSTLKYLNLRKNGSLERLTISPCTGLEHLDIAINRLKEAWMELPSSDALSYLDISYNLFNSFDLSRYPNVETVICSGNSLPTVNLTDKTKLKTFIARYMNMSSVSFADCPLLEYADLSGTSVSALNITKNTKLQELYLAQSNVTKLNTTANTVLRKLDISKCGFTELDLTANKQLEELRYAQNSMPNLDLTANTKLTYVDCSDNGIGSIDLTKATQLQTLICSKNNLKEFDASAYKNLEVLDCSSNYLDKAGISTNYKLYNVNLSDNSLTQLNVADLTELVGLNISSNQFDKAHLETIFYDLPDINNITIDEEDMSWKGIINFKGNPGTADAGTDLLTTKGWKHSYEADLLGDASAAIILPESAVNTSFLFSATTGDAKIGVDWGDGKIVEYETETYPGAYTNPSGIVAGTVIKIYSPNMTLLATSNNGVDGILTSNMPKLEHLSCEGNNISELDMSNNPLLTQLDCGKNPLTSLTLPEGCAIKNFSCSGTLLKALDLSMLKDLENLVIDENRLQELDLSNSTKLKYLSAYNNGLTSIDLSNNAALEELYIGYNELTDIDLSNNTKLTSASLSHNKLQSFDGTGLDAIEYLYLNYNEIEEITLDNPSLIQLGAGSNKPLTDIDLSKCPSLKILEVTDCNLKSIDYSANPLLEWLFVGDNKIESITYPERASNLTLLNAKNNRLESVDVAKIPNIYELVLSNNKISGDMDLSANLLLNYLDVSSNRIDNLTLPTSSQLEAVYAQYNNLTTLSVPSSALAVLDATRNKLQAVNISKCEGLTALFLDFNELNTLNLDGKKNLLGLSVRQNKLSERTLNQIYESLPDINGIVIEPEYASWMSYLFISGNPGAEASDAAAARVKGWQVVLGEELPVLRNMTVNVHSAATGEPIEDAEFTLILEGEEFALTPSDDEDGSYLFANFEVFLSLDYAIRVSHPEYVSKVVSVEGFDSGDVTVDVELDVNTGVEEIACEPALSIRGGIGCIEVSTDSAFTLYVYDMSGRLVVNRPVEAGKTTVGGIAPGLYIANRTKILVR